MSSMPGFKTFMDLDSSTTFCPCGASLTRSDASWEGPERAEQWYAKHTPHTDTDEVQNQITDDGMRACTDDTKRNWVSKR